jgi:hypothetical protein
VQNMTEISLLLNNVSAAFKWNFSFSI